MPHAPITLLHIGEDNLITWDGMKSPSSTDYTNDAVVTYNLKDEAGDSVSTGSLSYVSSSDGIYRGTLDADVTVGLTEFGKYTLELTADASGLEGFRRLICKAVYHERY